MPKPFEPLEHWRRRTQQLVDGLLNRIDELSVSDFPATTPGQLIEFLQEFFRLICIDVQKTTSEAQLRLLSELVQSLGQSLEWLDNAHTGQTPRGLVQLLKDLMDRLSPNSRVIARPQAEYNYSIVDLGTHLQKLVTQFIPLSKQPEMLARLASPMKLISFPRIERDNVLTHAIFGHELGHPIASDFLAQETKDPQHSAEQTKVQQEITSFVDQLPEAASWDAAKKLDRITDFFQVVLEVRKRALEELISDAVGTFIFGPSALFAMFEFLWCGNWDAKPARSEWYPPSRMRIRLTLELLDRLGWMKAFDDLEKDAVMTSYISSVRGFTDEARKLAAVKTDEQAIAAVPVLKIAYDWMQSGLARAYAFAEEATKEVLFSAGVHMIDLPELLQRIEMGVPPNEVGDPANPKTVDHRAALLAAWLFKLRGVSAATGEALLNKEVDWLNERTLRAVEYIILQNQYKAEAAGTA